VIVLEMLKLFVLPWATIHGNDCVGLCCRDSCDYT
jgi:hypothetical protein